MESKIKLDDMIQDNRKYDNDLKINTNRSFITNLNQRLKPVFETMESITYFTVERTRRPFCWICVRSTITVLL